MYLWNPQCETETLDMETSSGSRQNELCFIYKPAKSLPSKRTTCVPQITHLEFLRLCVWFSFMCFPSGFQLHLLPC